MSTIITRSFPSAAGITIFAASFSSLLQDILRALRAAHCHAALLPFPQHFLSDFMAPPPF